ncbi:MAG: apolipoprotein N-acyltransferase [Gammaproteobacteria bacterium]|nr:apolipoprotein N-acyltransferase [Gammaproteobacteria bacterium]
MTDRLKGFFSNQKMTDLLALLLGLCLPFAFAPYDLPYLAFPLLSVFLLLILQQSNGRSFWRGWLFGFGQFVVGFSWIYHSVHTFGDAPAALAIAMIILLAAYCALFPALAAYLSQRFFAASQTLFLLAGFPLMWALTEWLRGYLFTGFAWLSLGTSQVETSLANFAPLFGALGVSALMLLLAGLILISVLQPAKARYFLSAAVAVLVIGQLLFFINWSQPVSGPLKVSLPQLSVTQDMKWREEIKWPSLNWYQQQTNEHHDSDIVIWPETAIPDFLYRVKPYWNNIKQQAKQTDTAVVAGVFLRDPKSGRYYNSLISSSGDYYQKRHLVPLGEYMPLRGLFEFLRQYINFPMSNIDSGSDQQPLMKVAGYEVGSSICFEDVFDRDIRASLPAAKFLINASNDAWFKRTAEPFQHHQIARMRAIEAARYLIRSTNTGISAIIGPKGQEIVSSELFVRTTISGEIRAMSGSTAYVFWGNVPLITLAVAWLLWQARREAARNKRDHDKSS